MRDRASSTPLSTMSSIGNLGESDDNKPIVVDIPKPAFKRGLGDFPTIKKKP